MDHEDVKKALMDRLTSKGPRRRKPTTLGEDPPEAADVSEMALGSIRDIYRLIQIVAFRMRRSFELSEAAISPDETAAKALRQLQLIAAGLAESNGTLKDLIATEEEATGLSNQDAAKVLELLARLEKESETGPSVH